MNKSAGLFLSIIINMMIVTVALGAGVTYYSQGSIAPNTAGNWNTNRLGGGTPATVFNGGDIFVIQGTGNGGTSPHSMTTSAVWSISGTGSKVVIENGATLQANNSITLASATTFQIDNGGTFIQNVALAMGTTILQGTEVFGASSNFRVLVTPTSAVAPSSPGYGNLIINIPAGTFTPPATLAVQGSLTITAGTLALNTNNTVVTLSGNLAGAGVLTQGTGAISIGGSWTHTGTLTLTSAGVNYNGSTVQIARGTTYNLLKSNNSAGVFLSGPATVTTLTIGDIQSGSVFSDSGYQVTASGGSTLNIVSGRLQIGIDDVAKVTPTTLPAFTTLNLTAGTTIEYSAHFTQSASTTPVYKNLKYSGFGAKDAVSGTLNIQGNWILETLGKLNTNNNKAIVGGDVSGSGLITPGSDTIFVSGNWTLVVGAVATSTGPVVMLGASPTIGTTSIEDLIINSSGAGPTLSGNLTITRSLKLLNGSLTTTDSDTVKLGSTATLTEAAGKTVVGNVRTTRNVVATSGTEAFGNIGADVTLHGIALGNTTVWRKTGTASNDGLGHNSIKRYFDLLPATNTGLAADLLFHYDDSELNGLGANSLKLFKSTDTGALWNNQGGIVDASARTIAISAVNDFSRWTAGDGSAFGITPTPTITSISPSSKNAGDTGFTLTANGTNFFNGVSTVQINGSNRVTSFLSSTQLTAGILASDIATGGRYQITVFNTGAISTSNPETLTVNHVITASAGAHGLISPSGSVGVTPGADQAFTVTPSTGYHITDVLVDGGSVGPVTGYTFTSVTTNHTISASFAINTYTLTIASVHGSVTKVPDQATYDHGTSVELTAVPSAGYHFTEWSNDTAGLLNPVTITMDRNKSVTAHFASDTCAVTATADSHGVIAPSGIVSAAFGSDVHFTITPDTGYHIADVLVDSVSIGVVGSYTFSNISVNHTIHASFAINVYTITAIAGPNGVITPSGAVLVSHGADQSFIIVPNTGYHIVDVSVDSVSIGAIGSHTFTNVTTNHTITASFAINTYTLTTPAINGTVLRVPDQATYDHGTIVELTATPIAHYHFMGWNGDTTGTANPLMLAMNGNKTITATCGIDTFAITATAGANGSITPSGVVMLAYGSARSFTATPDTGYHIADVLVDSVSVGPVGSYDFVSVVGNHTIGASFAINTYTLTITSVNGTVTRVPNQAVYNHGTPVGLTATPIAHYHFTGWSGDTTGLANPLTIIMDRNKSITANFAIDTYTIMSSPGPNGTITPSGPVLVNHGSFQAFTITPNTGYHIADVLADSVSLGVITSYTFTNVTGPHTISANFSVNTFTISAAADSHGTISPVGTVIVSYGSSQAFTMTPDPGYHVDSVVVDGARTDSTSSYTFMNLAAGHTIRVHFKINQYTITASAGPHGTISPSGTTPVLFGSNLMVTMTPDFGYVLDTLIVDGVPAPLSPTYQFANVASSHTIHAGFKSSQVSKKVDVTTGWNLVSLPLTVNDGRRTSIFPSATSSAYAYVPGTGYAMKDTLVNRLGYWLKFAAPESISVAGYLRTIDTIDVVSGWNLIGATSYPVLAASIQQIPPAIVASPFFGYTNAYTPADTLLPAEGYWVKASSSGKIILVSLVSRPAASSPDSPTRK